MDRGSSKHSPRLDEEMAQEVRGIVQGGSGARAEEWRMPEPAGEDQPEVSEILDDGPGGPAGEQLSRFAGYIRRSALPGDREALLGSARELNAPDDVLERLATLPPGTTYHTVTEVWRATQ
jgi:hypothetical protein